MSALAAPATSVSSGTWPGTATPWPHQREAFDRARDQSGFMLAIPMGGGKSATAIALADDARDMRVLILCPKSVVGVWPREFAEHSRRPWRISRGEVRTPTGKVKKTATVAERAAAIIEDNVAAIRLGVPFAVAINFEATRDEQMRQLLVGTAWDRVIVDESHRIKAAAGKDSKYIADVARRCRARGGRVLCLTGTPMPHSPLDLFGQYRVVDETILGTYYRAFCAHYAQPEQLRVAGGQLREIFKGLRPDRVDEFTARVAPRMYQVDADELDRRLGLKATADLYRTVELSPSTRRVYDKLEKDLIAWLDDGGVVSAANAMVNVTRLAQAASGYAVDADTGTHRLLCDPPEKSQLLDDILGDLPQSEPVVVFARFHHNLDQIQRVAEAQDRTYGELSGRRRDGLTADSRMANVDVLGAQLKSGGVGIDLTRARYGIYYTNDWTLADYLQSRKRLHRPGQEHKVTYVHLLAENTIDYALYAKLRDRKQTIDALLERLRGSA